MLAGKMPQTPLRLFLRLSFKADGLGFIRYGSDLTADFEKVFRVPELFGIAFELFLAERSEVFGPAVADEERTADDVHDFLVFTVNGSAGRHADQLSFIVADIMW